MLNTNFKQSLQIYCRKYKVYFRPLLKAFQAAVPKWDSKQQQYIFAFEDGTYIEIGTDSDKNHVVWVGIKGMNI